MATLEDDTTARYSTQRIAELTNPQDPEPTTADAAKLALAATDVKADFEIEAGVLYDEADSRHVVVGTQGVIIKLRLRTDQAGATEEADHTKWIGRLKALARVTSRDRIAPRLKKQDPVRDKEPVFEDKRFNMLIPNSPSGDNLKRDFDLD